MIAFLEEWLKRRLPLEQLDFKRISEKSVPVHRFSWIYYLGGVTLLAFAVQVITGILLLLYYKPTTLEAHESIQYITRTVPGGLLVRNMHVWSSNAMILCMVLHAFTVLLSRAYRSPRELTWVTGMLSLLVVLGLGFSGYLLPWNNLSVYATMVGTQIVSMSTSFLPGEAARLGEWAASLLLGGQTVGQETLTRFFALHIVILPLILLALVTAHLVLIQMHGISVPISILRGQGEKIENWSGKSQKYMPRFLLKESAVWLMFVAAIAALSVVVPYDLFVPYTLLEPYSPLGSAPAGIKPEWYFWFLFYPFEMLPRTVVILCSLSFFASMLAAPWLLSGIPQLWKARFEDSKFPTYAAIAVGAAVALLTVFGQAIVVAVRGGA